MEEDKKAIMEVEKPIIEAEKNKYSPDIIANAFADEIEPLTRGPFGGGFRAQAHKILDKIRAPGNMKQGDSIRNRLKMLFAAMDVPCEPLHMAKDDQSKLGQDPTTGLRRVGGKRRKTRKGKKAKKRRTKRR